MHAAVISSSMKLDHGEYQLLTTEQIRTALKDRKVPIVAEETGLSRQTLYTLLKDPVARPNKSTIKLLSDYFERPL